MCDAAEARGKGLRDAAVEEGRCLCVKEVRQLNHISGGQASHSRHWGKQLRNKLVTKGRGEAPVLHLRTFGRSILEFCWCMEEVYWANPCAPPPQSYFQNAIPIYLLLNRCRLQNMSHKA